MGGDEDPSGRQRYQGDHAAFGSKDERDPKAGDEEDGDEAFARQFPFDTFVSDGPDPTGECTEAE